MKKFSTLILLVFSLIELSGQNSSLGFFFGGTIYDGDLSPKETVSLAGLNRAFGINFEHTFNNRFSVRGNLFSGKITGNDRKFDERQNWQQLNFTSFLTEASATAQWYIIPNKSMIMGKKNRLSPYVYGGVGIVNVSATVNGLERDAPEVINDLDRGTYLSIPVGLGTKYHFDENTALDFQLGIRVPTTDYLDGISESRNPESDDFYFLGGVALQINLTPSKEDTQTIKAN